MKSDVIIVSSRGDKIEEALVQAEKVAAYKDLPRKSGLQLRLLTEEMMSMVRSITGEMNGEFWIEDKDGVYELHLRARTLIDDEQRKQLIAVSTEGRNEATRGLMGKIRGFFDVAPGVPVFHGLFMPGSAPAAESMVWSMADYREQLDQYRKNESEDAKEAWDELEKSVVAHAADEVKVSIKGRNVEMTIFRKM